MPVDGHKALAVTNATGHAHKDVAQLRANLGTSKVLKGL